MAVLCPLRSAVHLWAYDTPRGNILMSFQYVAMLRLTHETVTFLTTDVSYLFFKHSHKVYNIMIELNFANLDSTNSSI